MERCNTISKKTSSVFQTVIACTAAIAFLSPRADAGGVEDIKLPPIQLCGKPVTVDGNLHEWTDGGTLFTPLKTDRLIARGESLPEQLRKERSVLIRMSYDTDALYVALDWKDPSPSSNPTPAASPGKWASGGCGTELHIFDGRVMHLASWPADDKMGKMNLMMRYDDGSEWIDATEKGIASAASVHADRKGYSQEMKIPWACITSSGIPPASGQIELMADFAWSDISVETLKTLPEEAGIQNCHFSYNFLTSSDKFFSRGYLPNPQFWGDIVFTDKNQPPAVETDPYGTGTASLPAYRVRQVPEIDGGLDDWKDVSFADIVFAPACLGRRYSAKLALSYDADYLYAGMHFSTPSPMSNQKRENTQQGFNGGDCIQIRMNNTTGKFNLCGWFDTLSGKAALTADGGDMKNPFLLQQGAREAFKPDANGQGYSQEIAIPWPILPGSGKAPAVGERWKTSFQLWWAGLDTRFTVQAKTFLEKRGAMKLDYNMPEDGEVALGLFDEAGALCRWIIRGEYRQSGANTVYWDGLDQWGAPMKSGDYQMKGIHHPPLGTDYVMTFGNPGNPPWPTADGKGDWLSDEASTQSIVTDGKWMFLAAPGSEKGFSIIALDENGQKQWGVNYETYPRCVSLSLDGDYLYALFSGPELTDSSHRFNGKNAIGRALLNCFDKRTGKAAKFSIEKSRLKIHTWPYREEAVGLWELRSKMNFTPANYAGQPRYFSNDIGESDNALGVAVFKGRIYVSLFYENKLLVLDASTAKVLDEIPVDKPVGLYAATNGGLLAVSGTSILQIDPDSKTAKTLINSKLVAPHSITTDRSGKIYVSDWGSSFQVKVFSPEGKFLRAMGREGGRPWIGTWKEDGMLVPRGVAVNDKGHLWVAEDDTSPKRVSVWNSETGVFQKDYIGPTPYGGGSLFWISPKDNSIGNSLGTRFKIDYGNKTYSPLAITARRMDLNQPFAPNGHGCMSKGMRIFYRDGEEYVAANGQNTVVVLRRDGGIYTPVAAVGGLSRLTAGDGTSLQVWDSDLGHHPYKEWYPEFFRGHAGDNFSWCDENGDGLVQSGEMRWVKTLSRGDKFAEGRQAEWMTAWGAGIAPDWSIFYSSFCRDMEISFRLDVKDWTDKGAPRYEIGDAKQIIASDNNPGTVSGLYVNGENKLFVTYKYENNGVKNRNSMSCFSRDGVLQWSIAKTNQQMLKDLRAENVVGEFNIPGIGNVICTWLWHGNRRPYLLSSDGIYIGTLLDDTMLGPTALWGESFKYYYQTSDKDQYIVNGASDGHNILKIKGLENAGRFTQTVKITEEDAKLAAEMSTVPEQKKTPKPVIRLTWADTAPVMDGKLDEWDMNTGVFLDGGQNRTAEIAVARDSKNLYMACKVNDDSPLLNKGENWQTLFITGDCVDIMLSTDPKADTNRRTAVKGDQRLLISLFQDNPIAVRYRPVVPGAKEPVTLMAARIDEIVRLPSAVIAFKKGDSSYTVEAAVQLEDLEIDHRENGTLRGDVGVIFSDETGSNRALRLYHYNKNTSMTADLTTEATLQPGEWEPVEFPLGRNLLQNGGFELPFASTPEEGWLAEIQKNGAKTHIVDDVSHSGRRSLLIEQKTPVVFAESAYELQDWEKFVNEANDGKGGGHVSLSQKVPVTAGKKYVFRMYYRSEDFHKEIRQPNAKERGYVVCGVSLLWQNAKQNNSIGIISIRENSNEWLPQLNQRRHTVSSDYFVAPEGGSSVTVSFKFSAVRAKCLPKLWIDDVELVEMENQ
ncbi:MAG: hypothetical protein WAX69_05930 [Victivallales bacterium]